MSLTMRRALLMGGVLLVSTGLDQWSKVLADKHLGTYDHPLLVTVTESEAGKPLSEVLTGRFGWDQAQLDKAFTEAPGAVIRFDPGLKPKPTDPAFRTVNDKRFPNYLWAFHQRTWDMPPRRVPQTHMVKRDLEPHGDKTVDQYLPIALPYLSETARKDVQDAWLFSAVHLPAGATDTVKAGERFLVLDRVVPLIGTFMEFRYAENPGAAWGFLNSQSESFRKWFFMLVSFIAIGVISFMYLKLDATQNLAAWAFATILSGALGNFIDRMRFNYVIDFIQMYFGTYQYPTYNVADIAITVGVGMLIIEAIVRKDQAFLSTGPKVRAPAVGPTSA